MQKKWMLGMAVLAGPVILTLYGERWIGAAVPLSFLMIAAVIVLGIGMHWEVFVLRKETGLQTRIEAVRTGLGLAVKLSGERVG